MKLCLWLVLFVEWCVSKHWEKVWQSGQNRHCHRVCAAMDGLASARMYLQLMTKRID